MGWESASTLNGMKATDFIRRELERGSNSQRQYKVLDLAVVGITLYAAVEKVETVEGETPRRCVFAVVVLSQGFHGYGLTWKVIEESMGSYEVNCPARILDLLTDTDSKYANDWREQCRANANRLKVRER